MSNFTTSTHVDPLKLLDIGGVKLYDASTLQWYHILIWTCLVRLMLSQSHILNL